MLKRALFALLTLSVVNTVACSAADGEDIDGTDDALTSAGSNIPSGNYRVASGEDVTTKITTYLDVRSNSGVSTRLEWNPRAGRFVGEGVSAPTSGPNSGCHQDFRVSLDTRNLRRMVWLVIWGNGTCSGVQPGQTDERALIPNGFVADSAFPIPTGDYNVDSAEGVVSTFTANLDLQANGVTAKLRWDPASQAFVGNGTSACNVLGPDHHQDFSATLRSSPRRYHWEVRWGAGNYGITPGLRDERWFDSIR